MRWVLFALILAENNDVTQANVESVLASRTGTDWHLASGKDDRLAKALGVPRDWALRAVKAVGNYGELYERNVGADSPLHLERRQNRLWNKGGLMYAPPLN